VGNNSPNPSTWQRNILKTRASAWHFNPMMHAGIWSRFLACFTTACSIGHPNWPTTITWPITRAVRQFPDAFGNMVPLTTGTPNVAGLRRFGATSGIFHRLKLWGGGQNSDPDFWHSLTQGQLSGVGRVRNFTPRHK